MTMDSSTSTLGTSASEKKKADHRGDKPKKENKKTAIKT